MSDDFYRFYWDGFVFSEGINVYQYTPEQLGDIISVDASLILVLEGMNSPSYFAVYTPLNELFYALPFYLGIKGLGQFVFFQRVLFTLFYLFAYCSIGRVENNGLKTGLNWLFLNPLLWLEGLGNLHVEGIIICIAISAAAIAYKNRVFAGILASISVVLKISTLPIFLYFTLWFRGKIRRLFILLTLVLGLGSLLVIGEINHLENLISSLRLFSETFEFNGSIYQLVNYLVSQIVGYNSIFYVGKTLNLLALIFGGIIIYRWHKKQEHEGASNWALMAQVLAVIFLLFSTTVHPWYLLIPLSFSIFLINPFVIAWSGTIMLSYFYYQNYQYGLWIWLEYLIPFAVAFIYKLKTGSWVKFHDSRL
ncbi:hypothetical protein FRX97_10335 [Luteibaculum oceani]|uniref:DUF2029 domain-containing protein n=2 Tax=Luteibaculum oceani TaxID=1294296 RepID=A0A5C6UWP1_9FLAO|nr:hypothetical protein FRX97_10335 [Luteibaculum oceani]